MSETVSPGEFASILRKFGRQMPKAVDRALFAAAGELQGTLLPQEMAAVDPPLDGDGPYEKGWEKERIDGGAKVGNAAPQAVEIERGRGPGPVPLEPLIEWVEKKGLHLEERQAILAASGKKRLGRYERAALIRSTAIAIQKKLEREGFKPRWVLRRAVDRLEREMPRILRRAVEGIKL